MNSSYTFKVGDKVKISKNSQYYDCNMETNPKDVEGTVSYVNAQKDKFQLRVKWSNGEENAYSYHDLELVSEQNDENALTVDADFVKQAHAAACSVWKKKIENQFPDLFPKEKYMLLSEQDTYLPDSSLYYCKDGKYIQLRHSISLIKGIAGATDDIPKESVNRGIYVNDPYNEMRIKVVSTGPDHIILFEKK